MANEIKLVTYANSEVTPQNDAVLTNLEIASNGVIFGCNVTIKNASTLHINAGMGVVYGREFEIVDSDIPVSLSSSGTLLGQLYVHIDLANTSEPAQLLVDTGNSLTPLVDDPTINITTGSTDYQLATFTVDTSTLANLTETFSIVDNPSAIIGNTDISAIADGTVTGAIAQINTHLSGLDSNLINNSHPIITTVDSTWNGSQNIASVYGNAFGQIFVIAFINGIGTTTRLFTVYNGAVTQALVLGGADTSQTFCCRYDNNKYYLYTGASGNQFTATVISCISKSLT